ncbi:RNA-directed DNA polymerase [Patescibacteria group bacterium]|nr:RNA-directed DNA polymerase [Patescibacteria group bacterium]
MLDKKELIKALPLANEYTETRIRKKRGGFRTLFIPSPELEKIQRKILRFFKKIWRTHYGSIHGLRSGSYVRHAKSHSGSRFIFVFDLENAFPSVNISKLKNILRKKISDQTKITDYFKEEPLTLLDLIIKLVTFRQVLPQGAPTSPFLFYLAITESGLFRKLWIICPRGYNITCYVDNFVISGPGPLKSEIQEKIFQCLEEFGFKVNPKKIRQFDCRNGAPLITGIRVDGKGRISLPKKTIRKWRGIIHRTALETNSFAREYLTRKIEGFIASLKPIYGNELPPQIKKPYLAFKNQPA